METTSDEWKRFTKNKRRLSHRPAAFRFGVNSNPGTLFLESTQSFGTCAFLALEAWTSMRRSFIFEGNRCHVLGPRYHYSDKFNAPTLGNKWTLYYYTR